MHVRRVKHTIDSPLSGQRNRTHGLCVGCFGSFNYLLAGVLYQRHPVGPQLDSDLLFGCELRTDNIQKKELLVVER